MFCFGRTYQMNMVHISPFSVPPLARHFCLYSFTTTTVQYLINLSTIMEISLSTISFASLSLTWNIFIVLSASSLNILPISWHDNTKSPAGLHSRQHTCFFQELSVEYPSCNQVGRSGDSSTSYPAVIWDHLVMFHRASVLRWLVPTWWSLFPDPE